MSIFSNMLEQRYAHHAYLCVGLDPSAAELRTLHNPNDPYAVIEYLAGIASATSASAAAFKPNRAFYDAMPTNLGAQVLTGLVEILRRHHPDIPVILDNKWGDIGNTNDGYVEFAQRLGVQAITLSPYMGSAAMKPFTESGLYGFVLCKTSNNGSAEYQDVMTLPYIDEDGRLYATQDEAAALGVELPLDRVEMPAYLYVASRVQQNWGENVGLVVGATYPEHLQRVLQRVSGRVILCPGVGAQGGDPSSAFASANTNVILVNASRSITGASDPASAAAQFNAAIHAWMQA